MHVDLTKSRSGYNMPASPMEADSGLHLYIDDLCVLEMPDEGCVTFRYKKGPVTATEAKGDRPARASADLRLLEICDVKAETSEKEEPADDVDEAIDELFEEALKAEVSEEDEVE